MNEPINHACQTMLSAISAYLDGDLDQTECAEIERHCASCARCAELVATLKQTVGLCRNAAAAPLPEAVRDRARASIRRLLDEGGAA
jgi:anti-sigma factor RsiW